MMNLHDQMMNLPMPLADNETWGEGAYKRGYRDARHAAAELALVADAEIARLQAAWDSAYAQAMQNGERANALRDECARLRKDSGQQSGNSEVDTGYAHVPLRRIGTMKAMPEDAYASLRKDAERYLKLRNREHSNTPMVADPFDSRVTYKPEGLDAALDALP